jgi:hypothetical protein
MATVTGVVCVEAGGDRLRDAGAQRTMTGSTAYITHVEMPRMIELHTKASQSRKCFQPTRFHIGMTNRANRAVGVCELLGVTTGARQMARCTGPLGDGRIAFPPMTKQTRQAGMIAAAVLKFRVVESLGKLHLRRGPVRLRSNGPGIQKKTNSQDSQTDGENESGQPPGQPPRTHQPAPLIKLYSPHQLGFPFGAGVGIA